MTSSSQFLLVEPAHSKTKEMMVLVIIEERDKPKVIYATS